MMTAKLWYRSRFVAVAVLSVALLLAGTPESFAANTTKGKGGSGSGGTTTTTTTTAKVGLTCTDTNNFSVQALHPSTFFVDPSSGQNSQWVGYMVTYKTGLPASASLTTLAGARLAPVGASAVTLTMTKDASANYYKTYSLLTDRGSGTDLSHRVVFQDSTGKQNVCTYAFAKVAQAKEDPSNTVTAADTANITAGVNVGVMYVNNNAELTMTVRGSTGILQKGNVIAFSPTPSVSWPGSVGMSLTNVRWRVGGNQFYKDRLWATGKVGQALPYVVEYTFVTQAGATANWTVNPAINVADSSTTVHSKRGAVGAFASIPTPNTTFYAVSGLPFSMSSSLVGGAAPFAWTVASGALPAGLQLDAVSGNVSGTPPTVGSSVFTLRVVDGAGRSGTFQYTIDVFERAIVTNAPPMASWDADYSFGPFDARGFTGALKWQLAGALPSGLTWNAGTRTISGRLLDGAQDAEFTVTVTDEKGASAVQRYRIPVAQKKLVVTPPTVDIPDLYLGSGAYGALFDGDAVERNEYGYNYGYATVFAADPSTAKVCDSTDATKFFPTASVDEKGNLATSEGTRWALLPSGALPVELNGESNTFCVEAEVFLRDAVGLGTATAKDVRVAIDVTSAARRPSASETGNGNLRKGDLTWDLSGYPGSPSSATPANPVCQAAEGSSQIHCRLGDISAAGGPRLVKLVLPLTLSKYVGFAQLRIEVTTSSREFDEMPEFGSRDLRHPNNVALFVLRNSTVDESTIGGGSNNGNGGNGNGNGGTSGGNGNDGNGGTSGGNGNDGNGGTSGGGTSGGNGNDGNGGTSGGGTSGGGTSGGGTSGGGTSGGGTSGGGTSGGGTSGGGTSGGGSQTTSPYVVDPSTLIKMTTPKAILLPKGVKAPKTSKKRKTIKLPSFAKQTKPALPKPTILTKAVMLPKTSIPLAANAASRRPADLTRAVRVSGADGETTTSRPLLMLVPGLPAGTPLYPALATSKTIRGKLLLSQDPETGGLIVQSDNGWSGKLTVPLVYYSKQAATAKTTTSKGTPVQIWVRVSIAPEAALRGTFTLMAPGKTLVRWQRSPSRGVTSYVVTVDGKTMCTVKARVASCTVSAAVGPKSQLTVTAIGGDSTRSVATAQTYASRGPVTQAALGFDSGSRLNAKATTQLQELVTLVRNEGFTTVDVSGFEDGSAVGAALARSRMAEAVAYLKARLPGVAFTGAVNRANGPAKDRVEIALR